MHFRFICGVLLFRGLKECVCVSVCVNICHIIIVIIYFKHNCRIHIMRHLIRHLNFWNSLKCAYDVLKCRLHRQLTKFWNRAIALCFTICSLLINERPLVEVL